MPPSDDFDFFINEDFNEDNEALPRRANAERARHLARRMPLVHFPVSTKFETWSVWPELQSHAARGVAVEGDPFSKLRSEHVFTYAGPSCFSKPGSVGDALLYFDPSVEQGRGGSASPFDSGSLEDPTPRLQPWASRSLEERWVFLMQHTAPLDAYRERFGEWLAASYDDPDRYLHTSPDRYASGEPDRTQPAELLEHNGTRGRQRYGEGLAGDRRAWTWEVRFLQTLPFDRVCALHVPFDFLEKASAVAQRMAWGTGEIPRVETLEPGVSAGFRALYADSGRVLEELVG